MIGGSHSPEGREGNTPKILRPKLIEGLGEASSGAVWENGKARVNILFLNGKIICGDEQTMGKSTDAGIILSMAAGTLDAIKKGTLPPPALIENILAQTDTGRFSLTELEERALQHNAVLVKKFLEQGGDPKELPPTEYLPDLERLKKNEVVRVSPS